MAPIEVRKVMPMPVKTPGSDSGSTTRRQVASPEAPRDSLASSNLESICSNTERVAITENGISTWVRPITTPRSLKISGSGDWMAPTQASASFRNPLGPRITSQP